MEVKQAVENRRSIRRWKEKAVEQDKLLKIFELARLAPSWGNVQPWRFIVVQNKETIRKLADTAGGQPHITTAPAIIVCCGYANAFSRKMHRESLKQLMDAGVMDWTDDFLDNAVLESDEFAPYRLGDKVMTIKAGEQIMIAAAYMTLGAVALGLGSCWVGAVAAKKIHEILKLPDDIFVHDLFLIGYPDEDPKPRPRKNIDKIVFWENYVAPE
ncbi:MAG: nitroreductase family protein [Desulfobacterales bacterium]|jgi:nitroreductase